MVGFFFPPPFSSACRDLACWLSFLHHHPPPFPPATLVPLVASLACLGSPEENLPAFLIAPTGTATEGHVGLSKARQRRTMLSGLLRRTPLPSSSSAMVMDEPLVPLQVFEVSVDRWDDVSGHATFRAELRARELPPELSHRSLSFAADAEAHAGLARILLPAIRSDSSQPRHCSPCSDIVQRTTPIRSAAAPLKEPWRAERVAQFDEFRLLRRELYAILSRERSDMKGCTTVRSTAGSTSGSDAGTATSDAASNWDEAVRMGEHGLPPFPPTLIRRSLGVSLSASQMRARAAGLDAWLRAVVLALPSLPPPAVALVATWMGLDGARAAEFAAADAAAAASTAGECDPMPSHSPSPSPSPSPPRVPTTESAATRAWGFRLGNRALPAPTLLSPVTPAALSSALAEKESPEHTEARVKITRIADRCGDGSFIVSAAFSLSPSLTHSLPFNPEACWRRAPSTGGSTR